MCSGAGSSDFDYLLVEQGITSSFGTAGQDTGFATDGYSNIQKSPLYISRGGFFYGATNGGDFGGLASQGDLWSNTTVSGTHAYYLEYRSVFISSALNYDRYYGFPVRCITRDFNFLLVQYGIAVNYVGVDSNATWATSGYNNIQANPIYIPRSGYLDGGSISDKASYGCLWSGTTISGTNAYDLRYGSSGVYPAYGNNRQYGFPVRCIT